MSYDVKFWLNYRIYGSVSYSFSCTIRSKKWYNPCKLDRRAKENFESRSPFSYTKPNKWRHYFFHVDLESKVTYLSD